MNDEILDKQLYQKFMWGNQQAFEELVQKYKNNIIYFISRYTKNIEAAEDISQDVFVYILLHKQKYNFQYSLKGYLYMIAKSKALNYIQKEKRIVKMGEITQAVEEQIADKELEEAIFQKDKISRIQNVMSQMKQEQQIAIYLADFEKLPYEEIGRILKRSQSNIKSLIYRSREKLKELLEKEGIVYENE